jgi:hypothetical protein
VPGAEHPGGDPALHQRGQPEQSQGVADLRPGPADPPGEVLVGAAEVVEELLVGGGFFERVELGPVQVLQQRVAQQVVVGGFPDDCRDPVQTGRLGRPQPALPHDELVAGPVGVLPGPPDHDGLQDPDLPDRVDEFGEGFLIEHLPGLARVGADGLNREFGEFGAGDRDEPGLRGGRFR